MNNPVIYLIVSVGAVVLGALLINLGRKINAFDPDSYQARFSSLESRFDMIGNQIKALDAKYDKKHDEHQDKDNTQFNDAHKRIDSVREVVYEETSRLYEKFTSSQDEIRRDVLSLPDRLIDKLERADRHPTGGHQTIKGDQP